MILGHGETFHVIKQDLTDDGRLSQTRAAATGNARLRETCA